MVYKRDDYTCQNCGRAGGQKGRAQLHAHHIVPKASGGTHSTSNLVAVCKECHNAIHGNSRAPSASGANRGQSSGGGGYLDQVSTLVGNASDFTTPAAKYIPLVEQLVAEELEDDTNLVKLEKQIQRQAIKQKSQLASFNVEAAPNGMSDAFVQIIKDLFNLRIDLVDNTLLLIEDIQDHKDEFIDTAGLNCPGCGNPIEKEAAFCPSCGEDLSAVGNCPDCGTATDPDDDFCTECGTELPDVTPPEADLDAMRNDLLNQVEIVTDMAKYATVYNLLIQAHSGATASGVGTELVNWDLCPNCGFDHCVFKRSTAMCIVCGAQWEQEGLLSKQWKMTAGRKSGEAMSDSDWNTVAKEHSQAETYDKYITGKQGDTTVMTQRVAKFSN